MKNGSDGIGLLAHGLLLALLVVGWVALVSLSHNAVLQNLSGWVGLAGLVIYLRWLLEHKVRRPMRRTRAEVIDILESALATGGDERYDDFISIRIDEPELESIRLRCFDVTLAPKNVFENTLRQLLDRLRQEESSSGE